MLPQKRTPLKPFAEPPAAYADRRHFCQEKDYCGTKTKPPTLLSGQLLPAAQRWQIAGKITDSNEPSHKTHFVPLTFQLPPGEEEHMQSCRVTLLLCTLAVRAGTWGHWVTACMGWACLSPCSQVGQRGL